jgi:hypothetical protein
MKKYLGAAAVVAVVLSVGFGSAVAAGMITSAQIQDFTILGRDMADDSVGSRVIRDDSIVKTDLDGGLENQLMFGTVQSGRTIRGAVGGDFDAAAPVTDWGVIVSLPAKAANALSDDDVFVNVAGWESGDLGQVQPTTTDTDAGCTGSPANPTAPAGTVCIYVAGGDNALDLNGYSVLPGTDASPYGFKLKWENAATGDTFVDAVWAYRAP